MQIRAIRGDKKIVFSHQQNKTVMNHHRHTPLVMILASLLLLLAVQPAKGQQQFSVIRDTVQINAADYFNPISTVGMKWSVAYQDWYFCIFDEMDVFEFWRRQNVFLAISKDGKTIRKVDCPDNFKNNYYGDLYVWHDTLFLHTYYSTHDPLGYYFDLKQWEWVPTNGVSNLIYEDDSYQVAFEDVGEWGMYTWFMEKTGRSGKKLGDNPNQYIRSGRISRIIRMDSVYYFIHSNSVVSTPVAGAKGILCNDTTAYYVGANLDYAFLDFYLPTQIKNENKEEPFPTLFKFTGKKVVSTDWWNEGKTVTKYDTLFNQAFRIKDQLFCITTAPKNTFIAQIRNNKAVKVYDFGRKYDFFYPNGMFRGKNLANNRCFLQFNKDFYTYGMMDVEDSIIRIRYLVHNQDTLPIVGKDNIKPLLEYLLNHLDSLSLDDLRRYESQLNGTGNHLFREVNGYFPNKYQKNDKYKCTSFYKIVNKKQTLITEYCVHLPDSMVKGVYLEWVKTNFFDSDHYSGGACDNVASKCAEVSAILTQITGNTPQQGKNHKKWTHKNLTIELYDDGRMVIY